MKNYFLSLMTLASMGVFGYGTQAATKKADIVLENPSGTIHCSCSGTTVICSDEKGPLCTQNFSPFCAKPTGNVFNRSGGSSSIDESQLNKTRVIQMPEGPYQCKMTTSGYQCTGKNDAKVCSDNTIGP